MLPFVDFPPCPATRPVLQDQCSCCVSSSSPLASLFCLSRCQCLRSCSPCQLSGLKEYAPGTFETLGDESPATLIRRVKPLRRWQRKDRSIEQRWSMGHLVFSWGRSKAFQAGDLLTAQYILGRVDALLPARPVVLISRCRFWTSRASSMPEHL